MANTIRRSGKRARIAKNNFADIHCRMDGDWDYSVRTGSAPKGDNGYGNDRDFDHKFIVSSSQEA